MSKLRLLFGISIFWLGLSVVSDGVTTLVLPHSLLGLSDESTKATALGLVTFVGLMAAMLVQPAAGQLSDRFRSRWGRVGGVGLGVFLMLVSLAVFGLGGGIVAILIGYLLLQVSTSVAQAAQQGLIPDLVATPERGVAAGLKGFMDIGGALVGFIVLGEILGNGDTVPALLAVAGLVAATFLITAGLVREPRRSAMIISGRVGLIDAFRLDLTRHRAFVVLVLSRFLFLLGSFAIGRFFLFFVADRLRLDPSQAAPQAGGLLAGLALITLLAGPPAGWAADKLGRVPLMLAGTVLGALGAWLLITATSSILMLLFGGIMALGTAAFAAANWAMSADLAPPAEAGRFMAVANFGNAGAAAVAGLFGPFVDWANAASPGAGYSSLFAMSGLLFLGSAIALRGIPQLSPSMKFAGRSQ